MLTRMSERKPALSLTRKDFRIEYFSGSGAGGQNRNKRQTACRVTHPASGAQSECQEERSAHENFARAFTRLAEKPRFKLWVQHALVDQETVDRVVREALAVKNLRYEVKQDGKWVPWDETVHG